MVSLSESLVDEKMIKKNKAELKKTGGEMLSASSSEQYHIMKRHNENLLSTNEILNLNPSIPQGSI